MPQFIKIPLAFAYSIIIKPFVENPSFSMFLGGIALVLFGHIWGAAIDARSWLPTGSADLIIKLGTAILGAGVFAVIMKSGQFTTLFRNHISEVFYDPGKALDIATLKMRWDSMTEALLVKLLPSSHQGVAEEIYNRYFTSKSHYHFERFIISHDVRIDESTGICEIDSILKTTLVVSPNQSNPRFEQKIEVNGNCKLTSLIINGLEIDTKEHLVVDANNKKNFNLIIDLTPYCKKREGNSDCIVLMERTLTSQQKFADEPYTIVNFTRFLNGTTVRARISDGYRCFFSTFGAGVLNPGKMTSVSKDGEGFQRWVLAPEGEITLPGEGYAIIYQKV